jgi:hypothetical protein
MSEIATIENELTKKSWMNWRVYLWLAVLVSIGVELALWNADKALADYYYNHPDFEYGPVAARGLSFVRYAGLTVMIAGLSALFFIPFRGQKILEAFILLSFLANLLATSVPAMNQARDTARRSMIKSPAEPLIAAIDHYVMKTGHSPRSLEQLVPDYLAAIPGTGVPRYPSFEFTTDVPASETHAIWQLKFEYQEPSGEEFVLYYSGLSPSAMVGDKNNRAVPKPVWKIATPAKLNAGEEK